MFLPEKTKNVALDGMKLNSTELKLFRFLKELYFINIYSVLLRCKMYKRSFQFNKQ